MVILSKEVTKSFFPAMFGYIVFFLPCSVWALPPVTPSNLVAHLLPDQIHLTWQDNSFNELGFIIQYKWDSGGWLDLTAVGMNVISFQLDKPAYYNHTAYFRVYAYNTDGFSGVSNEDSVYIPQFSLNTLCVDSPDGGEVWSPGSVHPIQWHGTVSRPSAVTITYSLDGGSNWVAKVITANAPNEDVYYWTVPNTPSSNCIIKVCSSEDSDYYDLTDHPFIIGTTIFDFDDGTLQGWTLDGAYDEDGDGPFSSWFFTLWKDHVEFPNMPGGDAVGDECGSMACGTLGGHGINNPGAVWWIMKFRSPDLSTSPGWQAAHGFSVEIAECMAAMTTLYANLYVRVYDEDMAQDRYFYSGTAESLTPCIYGGNNIWNHLSFTWSDIDTFPTNYTIKEVMVYLWGRMNGGFEGGVYLDDVTAITNPYDFNADGMINLPDLNALISRWLWTSSEPGWTPAFDLATPADNMVNLKDFAAFASHW
jgi:hypothetical protein